MRETLIADTETDNLLPAMTRLWMIQLGNADGDDVTIYADQPGFPPITEALTRLEAADRYVFHHGIGFDREAINRFYPGAITREKLVDTLVLARLQNPEERNHSLKAWGDRTGTFKGNYTGDFQTFDEELVTYARQDIVAGRALYHAVKETLDWGESAQLEHDVAYAIEAQMGNGFGFNEPAAKLLDVELRGQLADLNAHLQAAFPPLQRSRTFTPKVNNKTLGYTKGTPHTKTWKEDFNPASRAHVAERLVLAGWKPRSYGADGIPTVDERTLATLSFPEAKLICEHFRAGKLLGMLSDGKNGWLKLVRDGRIYGRVNPNGACTGRMSHSKPNVAQADKDSRMRSLWIPRPGWKLVGCDAEGLEARMLAHYLHRFDNGAFADRLLNGSKEAGTDIHSANRDAVRKIGYAVDRDGAKTLLYALMYGAGMTKLGMTVIQNLRDQGVKPPRVPPTEIGKLVYMALARSMRGLDVLTKQVRDRAKSRGYLIGLDGRHLFVRSEHSALNTLIQSGGAIVMKAALVLFMRMHGDTHGDTWGMCANVHDEIELETSADRAEQMGQDFAGAIAAAGLWFNLKCPLAGSSSVGDNWAHTH